jgi:hypothetical protein
MPMRSFLGKFHIFFKHAYCLPYTYLDYGVRSFGHFEKLALLKACNFSLLLKSARFEKREVVPRAVKSTR